jgi:hypothetical protein
MEGAGPRLEVVRQGESRWGWRYVDRSRELELTGNDTFTSEEEAVHSATAAYPDIVDVWVERSGGSEEAPGFQRRDEARRLALVLGATVAAALALRVLRRH